MRTVKRLPRPMLEFKAFAAAQCTWAGVEGPAFRSTALPKFLLLYAAMYAVLCRATVRRMQLDPKDAMLSPVTTSVAGLILRFDLPCSPFGGGLCMLLARLLCWQGGQSAPAGADLPRRKRKPNPFAGLTRQPAWAAGAQHVRSQPQRPGAP